MARGAHVGKHAGHKTIPFEPAAWLGDMPLQAASASTRGIWINVLSLMWQSGEPGEITIPVDSIPRMFNCTREEAGRFLDEASRLRFADIARTDQGYVTLLNRRTWREHNRREAARLREARRRRSRSCDAHDAPTDQAVAEPLPRENSHTKLTSLSLKEREESLNSLSLKPTQGCARAHEEKTQTPIPTPGVDTRPHLIAEKLYGRAWALDREAQKFAPLIVSLVRDVDAGRIALDRILAIASEVRQDHLAGRVKHRSAVFSALIKTLLGQSKKGGE
jgi:hypothetical protein